MLTLTLVPEYNDVETLYILATAFGRQCVVGRLSHTMYPDFMKAQDFWFISCMGADYCDQCTYALSADALDWVRDTMTDDILEYMRTKED